MDSRENPRIHCIYGGAPVRTRTGNQLIKSQLLYQLSYRGKTVENIRDFARFVFLNLLIACRHLIPQGISADENFKPYPNGACN